MPCQAALELYAFALRAAAARQTALARARDRHHCFLRSSKAKICSLHHCFLRSLSKSKICSKAVMPVCARALGGARCPLIVPARRLRQQQHR